MNGRGIILRGFTLLNHHAYENTSPLKNGGTGIHYVPPEPGGGPKPRFRWSHARSTELPAMEVGWIEMELFLEPIGMMVRMFCSILFCRKC